MRGPRRGRDITEKNYEAESQEAEVPNYDYDSIYL
jgi:hypothetical protein